MPCVAELGVRAVLKDAECQPENGETARGTETETKQLHQTVHRWTVSVHALLSEWSASDMGVVGNKRCMETANGPKGFWKISPKVLCGQGLQG